MVINALLLTLFCNILWPSYIALKIGSLPGITLDRLSTFILLLLFIAQLLIKPKTLNNLRPFKSCALLLSTYFIWLIISSTITSADKLSSIYAIFNWVFNGPFILLFILIFCNNPKTMQKMLLTIFITLIICNGVGFVENIAGKPLFGDYLITKTENTEVATIMNIRNEAYRIKSVFSNALVYAQFLLASTVLSLYFRKNSKNLYFRTLCYSNLMLSYYLLYCTGSRAGLALALSYPFIMFYIHQFQKRTLLPKLILFSIHFILIPTLLSFIAYFIVSNIDNANNLQYLFASNTKDSEDISTLARVLQIILGFKAILSQPIFGYGMGQALMAIQPLKSIDNYYLGILLSSGIVGVLLLLLFIIVIYRKAIFNLKAYHDKETEIYFVIFIMLCCFYLILSIPKADILFYFFSGLILLRNQQIKKELSYAST